MIETFLIRFIPTISYNEIYSKVWVHRPHCRISIAEQTCGNLTITVYLGKALKVSVFHLLNINAIMSMQIVFDGLSMTGAYNKLSN